MSNSKQFNLPDGAISFGVIPLDPETGNPATGARYTPWTGDSIELGQVVGVVPVNHGGVRTDLPQNTTVPIEEVSTGAQPAATGMAMEIVSSSALDVGQRVQVLALGAQFVALPPFEVTLNGTTPVPLPGGPFTRVNFLIRRSGDFVGNITVRNGGNTYGGIVAGGHIMRSSLYTVAAGYKLFIDDLFGAIAKDTGAQATLIFGIQGKPVGSVGYGGMLAFSVQRDGNSSVSIAQHISRGFTGPFDLRMAALTAAAGIDAQAFFSGKLVDLSVFPNA